MVLLKRIGVAVAVVIGVLLAWKGLLIMAAAVAATMIGVFVLDRWRKLERKTVDMSREEAATTIENFLNGAGGPWDWDDFISYPITDSRLDQIRARCSTLWEEFPAAESGHYCGSGGFEVMRGFIRELREPA
jgi:hypothetical protein